MRLLSLLVLVVLSLCACAAPASAGEVVFLQHGRAQLVVESDYSARLLALSAPRLLRLETDRCDRDAEVALLVSDRRPVVRIIARPRPRPVKIVVR